MTPDAPRGAQRQPRPARRGRAAAIALSLLAHAALLPALFLARADAPEPLAARPAEPIVVSLSPPPKPPPPPPPPGPAADPAPAAGPPTAESPRAAPPTPPAPPLRLRAPRRPPPPEVPPLPVSPRTAPVQAVALVEPWTTVGEAQLAGALTAGSGSGGGGGSGAGGSGAGGYGGSGAGDCDLVRTLQTRLRADPEVRAAVREAQAAAGANRALLVWNGDWVRVPGQSGKGLAGVRQAIALEVAFASEACRARPMRGLVLITFADAPGAPRLALGTGAWRWRDLLGAG